MQMDLSGTWAFQLDPQDVGLRDGWCARALDHTIRLPGSLQAQRYGDDVAVTTQWTGDIFDRSWFTEPKYAPYRQPGNIKVPFWLQPDKHYVGAAWYQRDVEIPSAWRGQRVTLHLERPHWETRVWLDEHPLGSNTSLSTPHGYDLGTNVAPGAHRLTIRVDNRMIVDVGPNAHSVSDHTQTNWNGVVGKIGLIANSAVWIDDVQIYPDVVGKRALVKLRIGNASGRVGHGTLTLAATLRNMPQQHAPPAVEVPISIAADGAVADIDYDLGDDAQLWDEFNPALYDLTIRLHADMRGDHVADERTETFGLREVGVTGTQLTINARPIFLRGTLECCVFPLTGYPPTDEEAWQRLIRVCQAHGLNHIRFHSWCPPAAAFSAADELGFYYQVECAAWANQGATIGQGRPLDRWLYEEAERIVAAYGNHPSFIMLAYGNEPAGEIEDYLSRWVTHWKARDGRRVYTSGAGWPAIDPNQYHNIPDPRIQHWEEELHSRINALPPETRTDYSEYVRRMHKPIVSHEIGQWCAYPNVDEIAKYTGFLKARNFEIFRDFLLANHMGDQAHDFLQASGKLQTLCYKEEIEAALRTGGFGGFQLLGLNDFPGQGTALVGVLDAFWDEKGYVSPAQFRRFCNNTVLLARMAKRIWRNGETFSADIDIAHFGPAVLEHAAVVWKFADADGHTVAGGQLPPAVVPTGGVTRMGTIAVNLAACAPGHTYRLVVGMEHTDVENDWDMWVFADQVDTSVPDDILVTETLDAAALARLGTGSKVLLLPPAAQLAARSQIGFSSVFWNTAWTGNQAPHTLGIVCDPAHPVFAAFPTEAHSNWQWWELIHGAAAMVIDHLPAPLRPLVQPIDTWFECRRLGLLVEANVGGGKLMICSMDLVTDLDRRIVARQLRHSLLRYMRGADFKPALTIDADGVQAIMR